MKRIVTSDVTQALVQSMEDAGEFKHVLVLAYGKGESANGEGLNSSFYCNDDLDLATAIFMLEKMKLHLLSER